jgi:hypothetical protein
MKGDRKKQKMRSAEKGRQLREKMRKVIKMREKSR